VYGAPGTATALALGAALAFVVAVTLGVALAVGLAVDVTDGLALGFTAAPLPQTNLPLFFTQVYLNPPVMFISPAFLHEAPTFIAADDSGATTIDRTKARAKAVKVFFISEVY
jgi:hypothetical protein